ncbi:MAG: glycosyltransferase family 2 protein [Phycisphaerae bacterium]|nr:glycosyltransferase family 2 protein [Phycisphaerae bacterium]
MSDQNDAPAVSVVSPMYNESAKIAEAVAAMRGSLESLGRSWEFILVNDGSVDDSLSLARQAAGEDPRIRIITYENNRGRGHALRTGFAAARGEFVVATEADLSWGTDIVHRLLVACERPGVDMVVASPHMEGGRLENVPTHRVFLTQFGNVLLRRLMPGGLTMNTGMTRAYRRDVLDAMDLHSDGKELHLEIISKAHALGFRMMEIPATLAWSPDRRKEKRRFRAGGLIVSHIARGLAESPMALFGWLGGGLLGMGLITLLTRLILFVVGSDRGSIMLPIVGMMATGTGLVGLLTGFVAGQIRDLRNEGYRLQRRQMELLRGLSRSGPGAGAASSAGVASSNDAD